MIKFLCLSHLKNLWGFSTFSSSEDKTDNEQLCIKTETMGLCEACSLLWKSKWRSHVLYFLHGIELVLVKVSVKTEDVGMFSFVFLNHVA